MKKIYIAAAAALLMNATPSYAGAMNDLTDDLQFGAGVGFLDLAGLNDSALLFYAIAEKEVDVDLGDTTNAVQVRLGTSTNASTSIGAGKVEASFNYLLSGLFKSTLELEDGISAYGLLGFSYASIDVSSTNSATITGTDNSFSYGFGADYEIDSDLKVAAEYTAYWSDATAFAVNAYYSF